LIDPKDGNVYATFYNDSATGDYEKAINIALKAESP
jgi:hypothetical protein